MKLDAIIITKDDLAAGVDALLAALEPADLDALKSAANRLSRFHAFAYLLLAPVPDLFAPQTYCDDKSHVPAGERHGSSPPPERIAEEDAPDVPAEGVRRAHPRSNAEVAKVNRLAVARALVAGPLRSAEIVAATGIPQGTVTGVIKAGLPAGCGWWRRVDIEDRNSGYQLADKGREALKTEGYILPLGAAPEPADADATPDVAAPKPARDAAVFDYRRILDRARCAIVAGTLAKLLVPLAAFTISRESGLDAEDVEKRLTRNPQWFERADCAGIKYKLTHKGRELAAEGEATV